MNGCWLTAAPTLPIPVRRTPKVEAPAACATERNRKFAEGRNPSSGGASLTAVAAYNDQTNFFLTDGASDAFYPFPDGVEAAASAGVAVVLQPGGSVGDEKVVEKADELGLAMVFTGERHFLH